MMSCLRNTMGLRAINSMNVFFTAEVFPSQVRVDLQHCALASIFIDYSWVKYVHKSIFSTDCSYRRYIM